MRYDLHCLNQGYPKYDQVNLKMAVFCDNLQVSILSSWILRLIVW
jgi:hypothetical protein